MDRGTCLRKLILALGLLLGFASCLQASNAETAMRELEAIMADEERRKASYLAGQERVLFCGYCHGEDGNSKRDYIPNLATQHPLYLFEQFEKFGDGRRDDYVMSSLAKSLSLQERIDIAVYYSQQEAHPREGSDPELAAAGERIYASYCFTCHGVDAEGVQNMPRLAGQPARYLENVLRRFKEREAEQGDSVMTGIAKTLSDQDVRAVAAYLQTR